MVKVKRKISKVPLTETELEETTVSEREPIVRERKKERRKQRRLTLTTEDLNNFEGISVGSRLQSKPVTPTRVTRDRQKERFEKRQRMKVVIDGEEKKILPSSKYMIDMLIAEEE